MTQPNLINTVAKTAAGPATAPQPTAASAPVLSERRRSIPPVPGLAIGVSTDAGMVRRHPGKDGRTDLHAASAHTDEQDQVEHDRASQKSFDTMTSDQFVSALSARATKETDKLRYVALDALPPALQAQVRMIQSIVTQIETEIAKPERDEAAQARLRARFRTGARSWHQNDTGKIPPPEHEVSDTPRAQFFEDMRLGDGGKVPTKQAKKGFRGNLLPYREVTAAGWQQAAQYGRLIYDPVDDLFYLTCKHYLDDKYFCIEAPRTPVVSGTRKSTAWDFALLLFQAWEELASELQTLAVHRQAPRGARAPEGLLAQDTMTDDAKNCVDMLYRLRSDYAAALNKARDTRDGYLAQINKYLENVEKMRVRGKTFAGAAPTIKYTIDRDGTIKIDEQFAPLVWCGSTFYVGSVDGYIGYPVDGYPKAGGKVVCPAYTGGTKIGEVGAFFRGCVERNAVPADEQEMASLTLAALVAEATRHPAATLEALFTVLQQSPFASGSKAFGTMLPMAAGGTIATGGIAAEVMMKEGQIAHNSISKMLKKYDSIGWQKRLDATQSMEPAVAITQLKAWIFSVLQKPEAQQEVLSAPSTPETQPVSSENAGSGANPDTSSVELAPSDPVHTDLAPSTTVVVSASEKQTVGT